MNIKIVGASVTGKSRSRTTVVSAAKGPSIHIERNRVAGESLDELAIVERVPGDDLAEIIRLLNSLEAEGRSAGNQAISAEAHDLAEELTKKKPNWAKIKLSGKGLVDAARSVAKMTPSLLKTAKEIFDFIQGVR
jgi:hypothetical protein